MACTVWLLRAGKGWKSVVTLLPGMFYTTVVTSFILWTSAEKDQPWGGESAAVLKGWVYGRDVRVEFAKRDQYGRILGIVFNGTNDVNLAMGRSGNAWHYSHFDKTPAYGAAEREAKDARRGLWSQPDPINPYDWRKAKRKM